MVSNYIALMKLVAVIVNGKLDGEINDKRIVLVAEELQSCALHLVFLNELDCALHRGDAVHCAVFGLVSVDYKNVARVIGKLIVARPNDFGTEVGDIGYGIRAEEVSKVRVICVLSISTAVGGENHVVDTDGIVCLGTGHAAAVAPAHADVVDLCIHSRGNHVVGEDLADGAHVLAVDINVSNGILVVVAALYFGFVDLVYERDVCPLACLKSKAAVGKLPLTGVLIVNTEIGTFTRLFAAGKS